MQTYLCSHSTPPHPSPIVGICPCLRAACHPPCSASEQHSSAWLERHPLLPACSLQQRLAGAPPLAAFALIAGTTTMKTDFPPQMVPAARPSMLKSVGNIQLSSGPFEGVSAYNDTYKWVPAHMEPPRLRMLHLNSCLHALGGGFASGCNRTRITAHFLFKAGSECSRHDGTHAPLRLTGSGSLQPRGGGTWPNSLTPCTCVLIMHLQAIPCSRRLLLPIAPCRHWPASKREPTAPAKASHITGGAFDGGWGGGRRPKRPMRAGVV